MNWWRRLSVSRFLLLFTIVATRPYLLDLSHLRSRSFACEHCRCRDRANNNDHHAHDHR